MSWKITACVVLALISCSAVVVSHSELVWEQSQRIDVDAIVLQAWDDAVAGHGPGSSYSFFLDAHMRQLVNSGDWDGLGYSSLAAAVYDYGLRMATHQVRLGASAGREQVLSALRLTKLGQMIELPETPVQFFVSQNHPMACDHGPGSEQHPFLTISQAAHLSLTLLYMFAIVNIR